MNWHDSRSTPVTHARFARSINEPVPVSDPEGKPNEQASLFVCDPSGNVLEFKAFADPERLFETEG